MATTCMFCISPATVRDADGSGYCARRAARGRDPRPLVDPAALAAAREPLRPLDLLEVLESSLTLPGACALEYLDPGADVTTWVDEDAPALRVRVREPGKPERTFRLTCEEVR